MGLTFVELLEKVRQKLNDKRDVYHSLVEGVQNDHHNNSPNGKADISDWPNSVDDGLADAILEGEMVCWVANCLEAGARDAAHQDGLQLEGAIRYRDDEMVDENRRATAAAAAL